MNKKIKKELLNLSKTLFISLVIVLIVTSFIKPTIVNGDSMSPTFKNKDYLIVNRFSYFKSPPKRGDIVVFKTDFIDTSSNKNKNLVKRVIALPGERIVIKNNLIFINNKILFEDYLHDINTPGEVDMTIPKGQIFVMGDNRKNSMDSREIGAIKIQNIIGKVSLRIYPFDKI